MLSLPSPPLILSLPFRPQMSSSPPRPSILSFFWVPMMVSGPLDPVKLSASTTPETQSAQAHTSAINATNLDTLPSLLKRPCQNQSAVTSAASPSPALSPKPTEALSSRLIAARHDP